MFTRLLAVIQIALVCVLPVMAADDSTLDDDDIKFAFRTKFNRVFTEGLKKLVCRRTQTPPKIDGKLDDACWQEADHTKSAFIQLGTKNANRRQMVVYVLFDDEKLYLAYICEEPELKKIRMRKGSGPMRRFNKIWEDDCVEGFFEIGAVDGGGKVFQILVNSEGCDDYYIRTDKWDPTWEFAGSKGANRWVIEVAMPFDQFAFGDYRYDGPPIRGEVWGLKLNREGKDLPGGEEKLLSCWEHNPYKTFLVIGSSGMLIFEDENLLRNATFKQDENGDQLPDHWHLVKSAEDIDAKLTYDEERLAGRIDLKLAEGQVVQLRQDVRVRPLAHYIYTGKLSLDDFSGQALLAVDRPPRSKEVEATKGYVKDKMNFQVDVTQKDAAILLTLVGGSGTVYLDEMRVEERRNIVEAGVFCLTGNAPQTHLNKKTDGAYTYKFPGTDDECFPWTLKWGKHYDSGEPDEGGTTAWIPFEKGAITGKPSAVTWPMPPGHGQKLLRGKPRGTAPIDIEFDLKEDYFIRRIDILPVFPTLGNIHVYVKPSSRRSYVLCQMLNGPGVLNPPGIVNYGRMEDIDSVARYVRLTLSPPSRNNVGFGVDEVRIYGEEKGDHKDTDIKPFVWKQGLVVKTPPVDQFRRLDEVFIYPQPQEMELTSELLPVNSNTRIVAKDVGRGLAFAEQIRQELAERFLVDVAVVEESAFKDEPANVIVIGEPTDSALVKRLADQEKLTVTPAEPGPQGYGLVVTERYALVCGSDQAGTFYGVQSLMQAVKRAGQANTVIQGLRVRDRPYITHRAVGGQRLTFHIEPFETFKRLTRGLARLKLNNYDVDTSWYSREKEQKEKLIDHFRFAEDHFMKYSLWMSAGPGLATGHGYQAEIGTDETYEDITKFGTGRINPCPSEMHNYENYFEQLDGKCGFAHLGVTPYVHICLDEMYQEQSGSRWNVCKKCLDRGIGGGRLYAEHITRIHDYLKRHNRETIGLNTVLQHRPSGYQGMSEAYDRLPRDMVMDLYHSGEGPEHDPTYAFKTGFERIRPWYGHGRRNRGKIHSYYWPETQAWGRTVWNWHGVWIRRMFGGENSDNAMRFAEQAWSPDNPPYQAELFAQRHGNAIIRFRELVTGIEYPSWRAGVANRYHTVDLRKYCNWSHIDDKLLDGKGWIDYGGNYDLRNVPRGVNKFAGEVPFEIIDPATNEDGSVVVLANPPKRMDAGRYPRSIEIDIGRTAASLLILRTSYSTAALPQYRAHFEGGGYLSIPVAGRDWRSSLGFANAPVTEADEDANVATHRMSWAFDFRFRPAWFGHTLSGDEIGLYLYEWVNPHPEKAIRSLEVWYEPEAARTEHHEVLMAVTVLEPNDFDRRIWRNRPWRPPLVPRNGPSRYAKDELVPLLTGAEHDRAAEKTFLVRQAEGDAKPKRVGELVIKGVTVYRRHKPHHPYYGTEGAFGAGNGIARNLTVEAEPIVVSFSQSTAICRVEARGASVGGWLHALQYCDYAVEASTDGTTWTTIAGRKGVSAENGVHVHDFAQPVRAKLLRVSISAGAYARDQVTAALTRFLVYTTTDGDQ